MGKNVQTRARGSVGCQGSHPEGGCTWARLGTRVLEPKSPVRGRGLGIRPGLEEQEFDRQGGVGRESEKGAGIYWGSKSPGQGVESQIPRS